MRINISGLMNLIADEERKFHNLSISLSSNVYSSSIQELNGTVNVIEEYKEEFSNTLEELIATVNKITKLKTILYEKNNIFKLSDGRTIQEAITENNYLRRVKFIYDNILTYRDITKRVTEVNNSYFEVKKVNFNVDNIKRKQEEINKIIQDTDFEISKLNSIEFEIDI